MTPGLAGAQDGGREGDSADETVAAASDRDPGQYETAIKPLLERACFDCHSGEYAEGNFRADELDADLVDGGDAAWWLEVYAVLSKGEMPPPESSDLTGAERVRIVDWLSAEIQAAEQLRKGRGDRSSFRRLTRYEYNHALQDLFGVPWTFVGDLPEEASAEDGFENDAESLRMSVKQVEAYRRLAAEALRRVTVRGERPPLKRWTAPMEQAVRKAGPDQAPADRSHYLDLATGARTKMDWRYVGAKYAFAPDDVPASAAESSLPEPGSHVAVVYPGDRRAALTVELGDELPEEGTLRVRVRASRAEDAGERLPSLRLDFGFQATNEGASLERASDRILSIDAAHGRSKVYQWDVPLGELRHRNAYRGETRLGDQPSPSEFLRFTNATRERGGAGSDSPAILIDLVEVTAPVYDEWPPHSHRAVFPESARADDETAHARAVLESFMTRAWRRPPAARDVDRKLRLFERLRPGCDDFQQAIVEVLATVLSSPKFLYVLAGESGAPEEQRGDRLSQHELATRLSLFLWCSLPDDELLDLAAAGRLDDPEMLRREVDRMLADPRADRFAEQFVQQWLKLRPLEYLRPADDGLDEALLDAIKQEPAALFGEMLRHDASVLEFLDADYTVVNERLAEHYGLPNVRGDRFRRVPLPAGTPRGGLLTQAGPLTMNSDGTDSHPVKRGVWLLTSLLNDPPPPPPPAVPEIDLSDPKIAELTLKERIEDHRNQAACLSCHQKIDPWGIAFEHYDATGRRRELIDGEPIDAASRLPSADRLDGMEGLKRYLIENRDDQFVRATVENMAAFALGRRLGFGDRAGVTEVAQRVRDSGDGLRTMVTSLVTSELFRSR
ncbi:DUF1592 domain-containing protein [Alienimonas chondri]|uniref:DUF1592 domain-containing protein n=1 Tax=Alienimonas chondri TaxID=2681879 RepID=UPI001489084B|nr:DUF1592 domain-containing protein [Alienimonas chondri]